MNVGQSANFVAATAVAQNTGASIASYSWSWGDGTSNQGQNTTHVFGSAGTFPITLTVTDTTGASAATSTTIAVGTALPQGVTANFASGWNLVGGPEGLIVSSNSGPLYTFQAGNTAYQIIPSGTALRAGFGYWAFFPTSGTITLPTTNPQVLSLPLPAGQYVMISNPGNTGATVFGRRFCGQLRPDFQRLRPDDHTGAGPGRLGNIPGGWNRRYLEHPLVPQTEQEQEPRSTPRTERATGEFAAIGSGSLWACAC